MDKCLLDCICCCSNSVSQRNLVQFSMHVLRHCINTARIYCKISLLFDDCDEYTSDKNLDNERPASEEEEAEEEEEEILLPYCENHDCKDELTYDDINTVMSSLGVEGWRNDIEKGKDDLIKEANDFLHSKDASMKELEETFCVFDRNEDGFITTFELWSVLRRLRLEEGRRYDDCERMIRVYDKDGDGRISFSEFKDMMEQTL